MIGGYNQGLAIPTRSQTTHRYVLVDLARPNLGSGRQRDVSVEVRPQANLATVSASLPVN